MLRPASGAAALAAPLAVALGVALATPVALGAQGGTQAAPVPTVAVFDFNAFSLAPGEDAAAVGRGLASMIATELANRPQVRVVDRQQIEDLIRRRQLNLSGRVDDAQALQLGQLLGAEYIVVGNVALEPKRARIDLRLLDVATGAIEKADRRQGSRDDFLALVTEIADGFTSGLKLPARVAQAQVTVPVEAVLAYSRGLDYEQRGMADRAAEMFRKALEVFPGHEHARAALERVTGKGGGR